ncbi:MAG: Hint domain-containing protein [Rhodobacteraceae bacterium]|nr:Hint domain-containing protein [Paracoccaceae bacterium]
MPHPLRRRSRGHRVAPAALDLIARGSFSPDLSDLAGPAPARRRTPAPSPALEVEVAWAPPHAQAAPPKAATFALPLDLDLAGLVCLIARGTLIETVSGAVAVEDLHPGMALATHDNGPRPLRWIARTRPGALAHGAGVRFVRIRAEAFGPDQPSHDMVVGSGFRLIRGDGTSRALTGVAGALLPVTRMIDGIGVIEISAGAELEFFALACDSHEVLRAGRLLTESFHPGLDQLALMGEEARVALGRLFPHLDGEVYRLGPLSRPRLSDPH